MKKIIVPYDFSEHAGYALDFACQIAENNSGQIQLLHVIDHPVKREVRITGEVDSDDQSERIYMIELIRKIKGQLTEIDIQSKFPDVELSKKVVIGNPFESIGEEVAQFEADLIVMGTKGSNGLSELIVGSNSEKVVRFSKCPVITVSDQFDFNAIRNIAFATNFEDGRESILQELVKYQQLFNAKLHLVWVHSVHDISPDDKVRENLEKFASKSGLQNYEIHTERAVTPDEGIMFFAQDQHMDMIAMTTHGRKGLMHLFLGSVAENVVNHANKPVWTFSLKAIS